jgi:hypothetical protein
MHPGGYGFPQRDALPTAGDIYSTAVTPGDVGTFGAWSQLVDPTTHAGVWVIFSAESDGGGSDRVFVELGVGPSGSEVPVARVIVGNTAATAAGGASTVAFPFFIPAGSRLVARAAASGDELPGVQVCASLLY